MEQPRRCMFTTRSLILLMLPIMGDTLLSQLVGMVDGIMVSSVGELAMSSVSLVTNFSAVIMNLLIALASGGSIVTSQLIGAEKHKDAQRSAGQVITMSVLFGIGISILCLCLNRPMLKIFFGDVEEAVLDGAVTYFIYDAASYPLLALCAAGGAILRSQGNSKTMFYVNILRNIVNIIGNAVCIYGLKMGVAGVAIPTALSRLVGAVILMYIITRNTQKLRPRKEDVFHINPKLIGKMLRIGLPNAIENSMFQLGRLMTLSMISGFGTAQIAANSTSGALCSLVVTFSAAMRTGSVNVIGQCVGAHDEKQIQTNYRKLLLMCYLSHCIASAPVLLFRHFFVGLYTGLSPDAAALAAKLMCIHLLPGLLLYTPSFFIASPLRAANDGTFCMAVSISSMVIFRLTLAQILCVNLGWGAVGVSTAMVADWICRSICFAWRWYSGAWKKKCGFTTEKERSHA